MHCVNPESITWMDDQSVVPPNNGRLLSHEKERTRTLGIMWMNLENFMLGECKPVAKDHINAWFHGTVTLGKYTEIELSWWLSEAGHRENQGMIANTCWGSFWGDGHVLPLSGCDGCTILWIDQKPRHWAKEKKKITDYNFHLKQKNNIPWWLSWSGWPHSMGRVGNCRVGIETMNKKPIISLPL